MRVYFAKDKSLLKSKILTEKIKASHTKEKITTLFYASLTVVSLIFLLALFFKGYKKKGKELLSFLLYASLTGFFLGCA
jgi:RsiW-degrading membrane proteinase PrsW (M82 family)